MTVCLMVKPSQTQRRDTHTVLIAPYYRGAADAHSFVVGEEGGQSSPPSRDRPVQAVSPQAMPRGNEIVNFATLPLVLCLIHNHMNRITDKDKVKSVWGFILWYRARGGRLNCLSRSQPNNLFGTHSLDCKTYACPVLSRRIKYHYMCVSENEFLRLTSYPGREKGGGLWRMA